MSPSQNRHLLLEQARVQLRLACRDAEQAMEPLGTALTRLAELLSRPLSEAAREEALGLVMAALPHLQFHDRQRQRLEHIDLALALAQRPRPGARDLARLEAAFTLPEERDALHRLAAGASLEAVMATPWRDEGPASELF